MAQTAWQRVLAHLTRHPNQEPQPRTVLPSLDIVRDELRRQQESLERRSASIDTKAGLVLGAAGILVSITANDPDPLGIAVQIVAATAGAFAAWSFLPRVAGNLSPLLLREKYIHHPADETALAVLDTLLTIHANDEQQLLVKLTRLRRAFLTLALAVLITLAGSILQVIKEAVDDRAPATVEPTTTQQTSTGRAPAPGASVVTSRP